MFCQNMNDMDKFLFYKEWCRILLETKIEAVRSEGSDYAEDIIKEMTRSLNTLYKVYEQKNLTLLKHFFKCLNTDIIAVYSMSEQKVINARLRTVCGDDLTKYDKRLASSVHRIVKRGKIRNGDEYEKVRTYIDVLEGEPEQDTLLQELYRLAGDFEDAVSEDPSLIREEWR